MEHFKKLSINTIKDIGIIILVVLATLAFLMGMHKLFKKLFSAKWWFTDNGVVNFAIEVLIVSFILFMLYYGAALFLVAIQFAMVPLVEFRAISFITLIGYYIRAYRKQKAEAKKED